MDFVRLLVSGLLPWLLGVALVGALHARGSWSEKGNVAWTVGAGWFAGAFITTLWMRACSLMQLKFSVAAIAVPLFATTIALALIALQRHRNDPLSAVRRSIGSLFATDESGWHRAAWLALVLWVALRFALLLLEVALRPMYPWAAWAQWATKARVWYALGSLAPFVDSAAWFAGSGSYTDSLPNLPATAPLLQAYTAVMLGRWDDSLVNLPWWLCGIALVLAAYGFLAGRRVPSWVALIGTALVATLPFLDLHIALAGYADLPSSTYLTIGTCALLRALERHNPSDIALAMLLLVAVALIKPIGIVWLALIIPGVAAAALPAWRQRIGIAFLAGILLAVGIGFRTGALSTAATDSAGVSALRDAIVESWFVFANWNLLWYGVLGAAVLGYRHVLSARLAPLTLIVAAGIAYVLSSLFFPAGWSLHGDPVSLNRATLHVAPLATIWLVLLFCEWNGLRRNALRTPIAPPAADANEAAGASPQGSVAAATEADPLVHEALQRHQRGDLDGAEEKYRAALAIAPAHVHATHYLGVVLYQRRHLDAAIPLLEASAAAVPGEPEFQNNLGLALAAADRNGEAIAAFRNAIRLAPDHIIAWNNLGLTHFAACNVPEAIVAYREAIARSPNFAEAHWNLALALLAHGEYEEGWREYEWRLRIASLGAAERETPGLLWDGAIRREMTLLVTAEQGMGDALQFVRYVRPLAGEGIRVILSAPPPLVRLLATAPGVASVVSADERLPAYDAHVPLMSLPRLVAAMPDTHPAAVPYLKADRMLRANAALAVAPFAPSLRIGLAWSGNPRNSNDYRRSIPLAALAPLLAMPGTTWFSLQRAADERDIGVVPAAKTLRQLPLREEFDGAAALMDELDVIVSVDTSLAHLAGGLGRPLFVLLSFAPDWRWYPLGSQSIWYPGARIFRQPAPGDWGSVVTEVAAALALPKRTREGDAPG
jgi:tetratricopeptide (TPR) repeat protein